MFIFTAEVLRVVGGRVPALVRHLLTEIKSPGGRALSNSVVDFPVNLWTTG
jgi:hypothetical protein